MQMKQASMLRKHWKAKGSPPCKHSNLDKEYVEGFGTGYHICTTFGKSFAFSELEQDPETYKWRPKSV